jgi:hypothetical protein
MSSSGVFRERADVALIGITGCEGILEFLKEELKDRIIWLDARELPTDAEQEAQVNLLEAIRSTAAAKADIQALLEAVVVMTGGKT